jgi:type I restriction enzyme M protein
MLDNETKRRIDTARDILVGKLPDPKSQVEQITIALIYKFMDDMDKEAIEFGGEPTFFTGDYEKYGWSKIFDPRLGGYEMLNLYGEAIQQHNQNPNVPQLFRDIFKNAYLPYRDPETLKLFLKTINEFQYEHSERLGDAFEYLLSVLGSQGDAGQFRTPRHIIDFIVEVIDPQKHETVCDPACGTAGFLISSYKHILNANTNKTKGDLLTPEERTRLANNFVGYDISPDMVRLSLVNMYLHQFPAPNIYEYDTLTSEERWNEYFDVIMANPPFMSPKGGIKPHKKFSLQANRSEVLFVDYIAEHINPTTGRAGVIVPEGIIFQSATAYKSLRKMLIDKNYLYAVVSLPAGVFQPYSGVKTSVLLMDKTLAAKTDKILFVKIADDGFGLGAQRKQLQTSDLPDALNLIRDFKVAVRNNDSSHFVENLELPLGAVAIDKTQIKANGDYNLSSDRYRTNQDQHSHYEIVSLGDVCSFIGGYAFKSEDLSDEPTRDSLPVVKIGNLNKNGSINLENAQFHFFEPSFNKYLIRSNDVLLAMTGATVGKVAISNQDNLLLNQRVGLIRANEETIDKFFLRTLLLSQRFYDYCQSSAGGGAQGNISPTEILNFKFPLPPLTLQKEIVEKIESYQHIIDGAQQVIANYKPQIEFAPEWEMVELGEACKFIDYRGRTPQKTDSGIRLITAKNVRMGYLSYEPVEFIAEEDYDDWMTRGLVKKGDVLITTEAPLGNVAQIDTDEKIALAQRIIALIPQSNTLSNTFLKNVLISQDVQNKIQSHATGSTVYGIKASTLKTIQIPLPPAEVQQKIVARIEREESLVSANAELITIFEQKITDELNHLWED